MAAIVQPIGLKEYLDKDEPTRRDINVFHQQVLHRSTDDLVRTADKLNIRLVKDLTICENCARAKIIKTKISRNKEKEIEDPGNRIAMDITGCMTKSIRGVLVCTCEIRLWKWNEMVQLS